MYLVIDTTNDKALVGLSDRMSVFSFGEWPNDNTLSKKLLPEIEKLIEKKESDLEAIFCVSGPGSFTGIRIGVATANALAYAWQIPVVAITRFAIYEQLHPLIEGPRVVLLDNIQDLVYAKLCLTDDCEYFVGTIDALKERLVGYDNVKIWGEFLATGGDKLEEVNLVGDGKKVYANVRLELIAKAAYNVLGKTKSRTFQQSITPLYINRPNITKSKK